MPTHIEHRHSNHTPEELFQLVADIEKYPEFLPWCSGARITERGEGWLIADLIITFAAFSEKYTSKVYFFPPIAPEKKAGKIKVELVKGPFSNLRNDWSFEYRENGSEIAFELDFKFRSHLLEKLIGYMFEKALIKMVSAFEERADKLFGKG